MIVIQTHGTFPSVKKQVKRIQSLGQSLNLRKIYKMIRIITKLSKVYNLFIKHLSIIYQKINSTNHCLVIIVNLYLDYINLKLRVITPLGEEFPCRLSIQWLTCTRSLSTRFNLTMITCIPFLWMAKGGL